MDCAELTESFQSGLFESKGGRRFVRCEFNPQRLVWIDVTGELWSAEYAGRLHVLDWAVSSLPDAIRTPLQQIVCLRMKRYAPSYMDSIRCMLIRLSRAMSCHGVSLQSSFSEVRPSSWLVIWKSLDAHSRSLFRSLYVELADKGLAGADLAMAKELEKWKAKSDLLTLRDVIQWDATRGAFTSLEWEHVREALCRNKPSESDHDCAVRIFGWVISETLKRPLQILSMSRDALWTTPSGREFFLRVPKAKGQTGEGSASWQITEKLAEAIRMYSERPRIQALQVQFDRLVVMPTIGGGKAKWMNYGQVDVATAKLYLNSWAERQQINSPRTHGVVNLTPYRIRHTGATSMALQGVPRDQIQEILEHNWPGSADAYIQAVGSDLVPALHRSTDRGVGEIFKELHNVYFFKGVVTDKVGKRPVYLPNVCDGIARPAVVGSCGKSGACAKHPFWACYNGCPYFLAWRDGPHRKSLEHVEAELTRWGHAEGGKERSKLGKDFDRVGAAIREVIEQVERSKSDEVRNESE